MEPEIEAQLEALVFALKANARADTLMPALNELQQLAVKGESWLFLE